jgi:phosphate transport system protein
MDEKLMPKDKFHRDIEVLKEQLFRMAALAEAALDRSITALMTRDADLAREVIKGDKAINDMEEELDNACVRVIALYQPVAVDLRQVMAVDHLIVELERLGDLAVNVAEEALILEELPATELHRDLARMTKMVQHMLRDSLRSFLSQDAVLAREVCKQDDEVDYLDRALIRELLEYMGRSREALALGLAQITVVRNLERAGDHATNIAEQVVYMVEGESIRHRCQG